MTVAEIRADIAAEKVRTGLMLSHGSEVKVKRQALGHILFPSTTSLRPSMGQSLILSTTTTFMVQVLISSIRETDLEPLAGILTSFYVSILSTLRN